MNLFSLYQFHLISPLQGDTTSIKAVVGGYVHSFADFCILTRYFKFSLPCFLSLSS